MTIDEIHARIHELQEEINELAAMLPEDARISFGTRYITQPSSGPGFKELVITVTSDRAAH